MRSALSLKILPPADSDVALTLVCLARERFCSLDDLIVDRFLSPPLFPSDDPRCDDLSGPFSGGIASLSGSGNKLCAQLSRNDFEFDCISQGSRF